MRREKLIAARKKKKLSQEQLAELVGISRSYLTNIERGTYNPSLKVAQKIAKQLNISTDSIFFECDARKMNVICGVS